MSKALIEKEFNKVFPNHEHNIETYRELMAVKYGEESVKELDTISGIVNEAVSEIMKNLIG